MNHKNPLVSVVVPVYNVEKYLCECLNSILAQTYKHIEVILIDDGSGDKSGDIVDQYAKIDKRIIVIRKQNEGASKTKNLGIKLSTGKYITFIDADDYIREDFIKNLVRDAEEHSARIVTTATDILPIEEDSLENVEECNRYETVERMFYGTLEKSNNGMQLFDRELLAENNISFDVKKKVGEDFDFFIQALIHCDKVIVDYRKMYYYRLNPTSTMNQKVNEGLMRAADNFFEIGEKLVRKYPQLQKAVEAKKFSDSVALIMRSYLVRNKWRDDYKRLEQNVKNLKWQVLFDGKARKKVRVAALIYCIFGNHISTILLRRIKK